MRRFIHDNSLGLFFLVLFLLALVGQAIVGYADYNNQEVTQGLPEVSFGRYLTSSAFTVDVAENWQSEYLQFFLYVFATIWFVQRGSPESKELDQTGSESDEKQMVARYAGAESPAWARANGWRLRLYSNSLGLVVGAVFLMSWLAQLLTGRVAYNENQLGDLEAPVSLVSYATSADFWNRTLQNWQSEFLAVGSFVALAIYLRQRGSAESKPVGAPHGATDVEG